MLLDLIIDAVAAALLARWNRLSEIAQQAEGDWRDAYVLAQRRAIGQ